MKTRRMAMAMLVVCVFSFVTHEAMAFYNPQTGRWLSRDPVKEPRFAVMPVASRVQRTTTSRTILPKPGRLFKRSQLPTNQDSLYSFVRNSPTVAVDSLGLFTFDGCSPEQIEKINKALTDNCDKAAKCAGECKIKGPTYGVTALCEDKFKGYTIHCRKDDYVDAKGEKPCSGRCGFAYDGDTEINLCQTAFDSDTCDGVGCTLFHESLHAAGEMKHTQEFVDFDKCLGCGVPYKIEK